MSQQAPTWRTLLAFANALRRQWEAAVCGGTLAAVLAVAQGLGITVRPAWYVVVLVVFLFIASFGAWVSEREQVLLTQDRPDIQVAPDGFYHDTRDFALSNTGRIQVVQPASMLHLRVINQPHGIPSERAIARSVIARLYFMNAANEQLFFIDGRWSDTTQPSYLRPNESATDLLAIDIPVGQIREIDVACKFLHSADAYGFNNDSYSQGLVNPHWRLPRGDYRVRVQVIGTLVNSEWTFAFRVGDSNETLTIL